MLFTLANDKQFHIPQHANMLKGETDKQYKSGHNEEVQELLL